MPSEFDSLEKEKVKLLVKKAELEVEILELRKKVDVGPGMRSLRLRMPSLKPRKLSL